MRSPFQRLLDYMLEVA
jgi:hypothetical protein